MGVLPSTGPTFTATFEWAENGTWTVALVEEPNVHGFGGTLVEARRNIRDAITTLFGPFDPEPHGFGLVEDLRLPEPVLVMVREARLSRDQANELRTQAQAAQDAVTAMTGRAMEATRQAAHLVVEHGSRMNASADTVGIEDDIRLPDPVLVAIQKAHLERQAARRQRELAREAEEVAAAVSDRAVRVNRDVARLLTEQCGLPTAEAAGFLGLSVARAQRLLQG